MSEIPFPEALRAQVLERLGKDPPPPPRSGARFVPLAVALGLQLAFGVGTLRGNFWLLDRRAILGVSLSLGLLALATLSVVLTPGRLGLGATVGWLRLLGVLAAPLYAACTLLWPLGTFDKEVAAWGCMIGSGVLGVTVVAGLTFALRRAVPSAIVARAALIGATGGAWAGFAMHLHCPACDRSHILFGHVVPIVLLTLGSAMVLPRWLRP